MDESILKTSNIAVQGWYDQSANPGYDFAKPNTGFGGAYDPNPNTAEFTQILWKRSTKLGCGVSGAYVVCRYCEIEGNQKNGYKDNVLAKGSAPKDC